MAVPQQPEGEEELAALVLAFRREPDTQAFWPLAQVRLAAGRLDDAIETAVRLAEESADGVLAGSGVLVTGSVITAGDARALLRPGTR